MPEGLSYVLAAYGATLVTLLVWFWMIRARFQRVRRVEQAQAGQTGGTQAA